MTVRELIAALDKIENQDAEVQTWSYSTMGDIDEVKYRADMGDGVVLLLDSES